MKPLEEVSNLKIFLQSLGSNQGDNESDTDSALASKAKKLVETLLRNLKLKYHLKKKRTESGLTLRHEIKIHGVEYVLKTVVTYQSKYLSSVLWNKDEQKLIHVVTVGPLHDYYILRAVGEKRLKAWMENGHGPEQDRGQAGSGSESELPE